MIDNKTYYFTINWKRTLVALLSHILFLLPFIKNVCRNISIALLIHFLSHISCCCRCGRKKYILNVFRLYKVLFSVWSFIFAAHNEKNETVVSCQWSTSRCISERCTKLNVNRWKGYLKCVKEKYFWLWEGGKKLRKCLNEKNKYEILFKMWKVDWQ